MLREKYENPNIDFFGIITVVNNVHIGTNATIMPGVNIGDNCIIGCDAVVTHDVPENSIVVGVPARVIETIDEYAEKHKYDFDYNVRQNHMNQEEKRRYIINKYMK